MSQIWEPTEKARQESRLMDFARTAENRFNHELPNYAALHNWSTDYPEEFWSHAWDYLGMIGT